MAGKKLELNIQNRRQLFDVFQSQMQGSYTDLKRNQRLSFESGLIKSYLFEANYHNNSPEPISIENLNNLIKVNESTNANVTILPTDEPGFYTINVKNDNRNLFIYLDTSTDNRFWIGYSMSESQHVDRWLESIVKKSGSFDMVWLWPGFLENIHQRGLFRGFGLDYDYRKFEDSESEVTTYLKMQLWGGESTKEIYDILKNHEDFNNKVVLSKVRFKEISTDDKDSERFAIQDVKYNGKFTARGTDFDTHLVTLNHVRSKYKETILSIEDNYALKWESDTRGKISLEGYAIHFLPSFEIPITRFVERVFDGTEPFRLIGYPTYSSNNSVVLEVVDLHTGGKLSFVIYPDVFTVYLPEHTCGNTIARLFTNIQHYFDIRFKVESDNGDVLFN